MYRLIENYGRDLNVKQWIKSFKTLNQTLKYIDINKPKYSEIENNNNKIIRFFYNTQMIIKNDDKVQTINKIYDDISYEIIKE